MNNLVSKTYRDVIDEVCAKVRTEFIEGSVSECVGLAGGDWNALADVHMVLLDTGMYWKSCEGCGNQRL